MYSGMTKSALEWQIKIRKFVDNELIPWEVHAEKNFGNLPSDIEKKHSDIAIKLGLPGMGISKKEGGLELSMFEQMVIWEQLGRVTNALCWCFSEAQDWMEENFTPFQKENYLYPLLKGEKKENHTLRISVSGGGCSGMTYKMSFDNNQEEFDKIFESEGLKIVCDLQSWLYLKGTNIEYSDDMLNGGFKITNPNAERTCGCGTSFSV